MYNGVDRLDLKMKRIAYYTKRDRNKLKKIDLGEYGGQSMQIMENEKCRKE